MRLSLLCEMLADAQRESGATFLVSTHNMSAARHLADNLAVISDGRIVESGPAAAVFDSEQPLVRQLISGATSGPITLRDVSRYSRRWAIFAVAWAVGLTET